MAKETVNAGDLGTDVSTKPVNYAQRPELEAKITRVVRHAMAPPSEGRPARPIVVLSTTVGQVIINKDKLFKDPKRGDIIFYSMMKKGDVIRQSGDADYTYEEDKMRVLGIDGPAEADIRKEVEASFRTLVETAE